MKRVFNHFKGLRPANSIGPLFIGSILLMSSLSFASNNSLDKNDLDDLIRKQELLNKYKAVKLKWIETQWDLAHAKTVQQLKLEKLQDESLKTQLEILQKQSDLEKNELQNQHTKLDLKIKIKEKEKKLKECSLEPVYLSQPYNELDQSLVLSDRQIELKGTIGTGTARKIVQQLDYYNNLSHDPIFLMINSGGGSVMEGFEIVEAIRNSKAPVYSVVKSYAASMAAIILTSSPHSLVFPNARILFHEPSTGSSGNTSHHRDRVSHLEKIEKRMMGPILEKLGYESIEQWRDDLYANSVDGDWVEFGDDAVQRKWANHVVRRIQDTSICSNPVESGFSYRSSYSLYGQKEMSENGNDDNGVCDIDIDMHKNEKEILY